jgi:hypothetical protein
MNISLLGVTAAMLSALVAACILPQRAEAGDDAGDGRSVVLIPRPVPTTRHRPRTWTFLAVTAALGLVFAGWRRPGFPQLYAGAVRAVAVAISRDPAGVNGYIARLRPATLFLAVAYIVGISLVVRADIGRRLVMLAHAPLDHRAGLGRPHLRGPQRAQVRPCLRDREHGRPQAGRVRADPHLPRSLRGQEGQGRWQGRERAAASALMTTGETPKPPARG